MSVKRVNQAIDCRGRDTFDLELWKCFSGTDFLVKMNHLADPGLPIELHAIAAIAE